MSVSSPGAQGRPAIDLDALIDGQRIRASTVLLMVVGALSMIADGFDISAMSFVAPELIKGWHVAPKALVPVFSAGIFGLLLGGPLLGSVGDRFGRKRTVAGILAFVGVATLATAAATSLNQFTALRFVTGIGLGGLIPNVIALMAEVAPRRRRGLIVTVVNFGVPAGLALPGWTAALLVPRFGWPVLLLVGGALALLVCAAGLLFLPESLRYLAQRGDRAAEMERLARRMRPDLVIAPGTRITVPAQAVDLGPSPVKLFAGGLAVATPLLWGVVAANQFTNFFTISWLPTLLQADGASTAQAGVSTAMYSVGGMIGGLALMFLVDRLGVLPIVALFALGVPVVAAVGLAPVSPGALAAIIAGAGFCVSGNNIAMGAILGMVYPTPLRAKGVGWAQALGRIGALGAQYAGGALLARQLPLRDVFLAPALSLLAGAVAAAALAVVFFRRFGGYRLDEAGPSPAASTGLLETNIVAESRATPG